MTLTEAKKKYREKVSEDFSLWEFVYSKTAEEQGINNAPPSWAVDNIYRLGQNLLQPLRTLYGKSIEIAGKGGSGYRCRALNAAAGGSSTSSHIWGLAADCHVDDPAELARTLLSSGLLFDQCILYPSFVHIGLKLARDDNRRQVLYNKSYKGVEL